MEILIFEPENYASQALNNYSKIGNVWFPNQEFQNDDIDVLVVRLVSVTKDGVLKKYKNLKHIITNTTGDTHIDLVECRRRGIQVHNFMAHTEKLDEIRATSEIALWHLICGFRKVHLYNRNLLKGSVDRLDFLGSTISGKTIGIVGMGRIGRHTAVLCEALKANIVWFDPYKEEAPIGRKLPSLEVLFAVSNAVSLHLPLNDLTKRIIDEKLLFKLKPGSIMINTSRGGIVDELAIENFLISKKIGYYGTDVLACEEVGNESKSPLLNLFRDGHQGINITPHIGGAAKDAFEYSEIKASEIFLNAMTN